MTHRDRPRCRRCGTYDYVHNPDYNPWPPGSEAHASFAPTTHRFSRATRLELWFKDHRTIWFHLKAWAWLNLRSSKSRWDYIQRLHDQHPDACWCNVVDAAWRADHLRDDYREPNGCVCHFALPHELLRPPPPEGCYCTPAQTTIQQFRAREGDQK